MVDYLLENAILAWSGGKDSALALYEILNMKKVNVQALLTTITEDYSRVSMHGFRTKLLEQQVESLGFKLEKVLIPKNCTNEKYDLRMHQVMKKYHKEGIKAVIFGDIFLEDVRQYRESNLAKIGMIGIFPLWKLNTSELAIKFIELGFKAVITCIDSKVLDKNFVGRTFDKQLISELPSNIDPCGENGEFHSFVYSGPIFQNEISFTLGEVVSKDDRFYYCDLLPH